MAYQNFHRASERATPRRRSSERQRWDAMIAEGRIPQRAHKPRVSDGDAPYEWECSCGSGAAGFATLADCFASADAHRDDHARSSTMDDLIISAAVESELTAMEGNLKAVEDALTKMSESYERAVYELREARASASRILTEIAAKE